MISPAGCNKSIQGAARMDASGLHSCQSVPDVSDWLRT